MDQGDRRAATATPSSNQYFVVGTKSRVVVKNRPCKLLICPVVNIFVNKDNFVRIILSLPGE